jgi:hypothetical protein
MSGGMSTAVGNRGVYVKGLLACQRAFSRLLAGFILRGLMAFPVVFLGVLFV